MRVKEKEIAECEVNDGFMEEMDRNKREIVRTLGSVS
jgi:hypothetical protein